MALKKVSITLGSLHLNIDLIKIKSMTISVMQQVFPMQHSSRALGKRL